MALGRSYRGQTRRELADKLTRTTGDRWTPAMISRLEVGDEDLATETLLAIAEAQGFPFSFYLEDPKGRYLGL